jgi:endonuclease YncB( thermonuclease family)
MVEAERLRMRPAPPDRGGAPVAASPTPAVPAAAAETPPAPDAAPPLQGVPTVVDTATLLVQGQTVHLSGVAGEAGEYGEALNRFIGGRSVTCLPTPGGAAGEYHCFIGRNDLARAIIGGGVGRTTEAADPALRAAEQWARARRLGIWE